MLPHKEYLKLKELCEKHKIDASNEHLSKLVKVSEDFSEFQNPILHKRIENLRNIIRKRTIPNGKIAVSKDLIWSHNKTIVECLRAIDNLMLSSQTKGNGKLIARTQH